MKTDIPNYITGSYAVGTEIFTVTDTERTEVLGPGKGPRKMSVRMYYPVEKSATDGKEKANIFTLRKLQALQKAFHFKMPKGELPKADYYEGVAHAEGQKFPLVIYNHGYGAYAEAKFMIPIKAVVGKMDGIKMHKRLCGCHFEVFDQYLR